MLNDAERASISTEYKQISPFEARKRGAAMVPPNVGLILQQQVMDKPRLASAGVLQARQAPQLGAVAGAPQIGF